MEVGCESAPGQLPLAFEQFSGLAGLVDQRAAHEAIGRVLLEALGAACALNGGMGGDGLVAYS